MRIIKANTLRSVRFGQGGNYKCRHQGFGKHVDEIANDLSNSTASTLRRGIHEVAEKFREGYLNRVATTYVLYVILRIPFSVFHAPYSATRDFSSFDFELICSASDQDKQGAISGGGCLGVTSHLSSIRTGLGGDRYENAE